MAVRELFKTGTLGGYVFWENVGEFDGWRIQYNKTLDKFGPLKPYRLLDPNNMLIASADCSSDFDEKTVTNLASKYASKEGLEIEKIVTALSTLIVPIVTNMVQKGQGN